MRHPRLRHHRLPGPIYFCSLITALLTVASLFVSNNAATARDGLMAPDVGLVNATVHTMDTNRPLAEAVAVLGNRIVAVGSSAEMCALVGNRTRVIDAAKRLVLPGFND